MSSPIKLRTTIGLLIAIGLGAIALGQSISADLHLPAARILAAECQGFEALATAGGKPLTCNPQQAAGDPHGAVAADLSLATSVVAARVQA